jgi:acyl carrier protein
VREAAVVAREDAPGDKRLVAYVVAAAAQADPAALRAHLAERLPAFLLPAAIVRMDALPLNANGKVDRRALPAPAPSDLGRDPDAVLPRTATEATLAVIWTDLLHCGPVGANDDFFSLGGHSLLAVQVASRIRDAFGVELQLTALFEEPTLEGLAQRVDALRGKQASGPDGEHEEIEL